MRGHLIALRLTPDAEFRDVAAEILDEVVTVRMEAAAQTINEAAAQIRRHTEVGQAGLAHRQVRVVLKVLAAMRKGGWPQHQLDPLYMDAGQVKEIILSNHGYSPICRILRIGPVLNDSAQSMPPTHVEPQPRTTLRTTEEQYPPGVVRVYFRTDVAGRVNSAYAVSGDPAFYWHGVQAAYRIKSPRRKYRGHPIATAGLVIYEFDGVRRTELALHSGPAIIADY